MMKLTKREQGLLVVFLIILTGWLYAQFIIIPQMNKITDLNADQQLYYDKLMNNKVTLTSSEKLNEALEGVSGQVRRMQAKYFSTLNQEDIVYVLNTFLEETDLQVTSISFSEPAMEDTGEDMVKKVSVNLPFEGKYEDLMIFLDAIRNYEKNILINHITISNREDGDILGQLSLDFYSLSVSEQDNGMVFVWKDSGKNSAQTANPFTVFDAYEGQVNEGIFEGENIQISFGQPKIILEGFETDKVDFTVPRGIRGKAKVSNTAKDGNHAVMVNFASTIESHEKTATILLDQKNITLPSPPDSMSLWVYAQQENKDKVYLTYKTATNEVKKLYFADSVNWIGWKQLSAVPTQDINSYPVEITSIVFENKEKTEVNHTYYIDNLESYYPSSASYNPVKGKTQNYIKYEVQIGDTFKSISEKFYGDRSNATKIMKINRIKGTQFLHPGKLLIIPEN